MRGPSPKDAKTRQRRNKEATTAMLVDDSPLEDGKIPELPDREDGKWRKEAVSYWQDIWDSPMASEYTQADVEGLIVLMDLIHRYWEKPTTALAAEIRLQRQCYGLTPIDRRRLQWEIKRVETPQKPEKPKRPEGQDPRSHLKAV